jgi:hypothetical protein
MFFGLGKAKGINMETNLDLLRTVETKTPKGSNQVSTLRLFAAVLAIAALVAFGMRHENSNAAATVGSVAYCVTTDGSAADAGLQTGLYTFGANQLSRYSAGETDHNGCGVFNFVPVGQLFFVSAWSDDGTQIGNSSWFESDAMTIAPTVQLDTPGFYNRLALH